ncbi:DNA excision repair protein ERCC-6-like [Latimeria chalumnae]|uniref:DNA excision repair protein ERCC-6-like n=1 Tax=Latimeria chalumnae TaxID=7897 RepID=UPI00313BEAD0
MLYKELYDKLFEHQKEGIAFLYNLYKNGRKGGILADDMGLGKTIQVIAFLSGMFDASLVKAILLVMPTTLITNWCNEFDKWTPGMRFKVFHGINKNDRTRSLESIQRRGGVIITTYQMLISNWQQLASFNGEVFTWDYMVLDEAHKIKTTSTKTSKSAHAIPARYRILLTGTPVQNNLSEMWSLFDFACQGTLLGSSKTFKSEYENPITRARERDATPGEKALGLKISENLMHIIKPYFLRRTKEEVQKKSASDSGPKVTENLRVAPEMPSLTRKNDFVVWVYLSPVQEKIYRQFISLDQIKELLMTTRSPLAELTTLKKLCDHPRLMSAKVCGQLGLEGQHDFDLTYKNSEAVQEDGASKIDHLSDETLIQESGKLTFLMSLLEKLRDEGHRILIFSQSSKMLDIIQRILMNKGFKMLRIDGKIRDIAEREKRIRTFQEDKDYSVFLLTTQVGGVGITLTAANRVVIFDPSWNPATDAQAVDRAYRIGQKENVVIYRLITCGTVEEKIYRRQVFKDSLIRQTTGDKKNPFRYFTKQELKELFILEDARTSSTQIQLQSLHTAQRRTDTELDEHIAFLHTLSMFGISDHDLMYEVASHEDHIEDEGSQQYIHNRVQKAHELVKAESELHEQFNEKIKLGTEAAWLQQPDLLFKPKEKQTKVHPSNFTPSWTEESKFSPPQVGDLTQSVQDEEVHNVSCKMEVLVLEQSVEEEDVELNDSNVTKSPVKKEENGETIILSDEESEQNPCFSEIIMENSSCHSPAKPINVTTHTNENLGSPAFPKLHSNLDVEMASPGPKAACLNCISREEAASVAPDCKQLNDQALDVQMASPTPKFPTFGDQPHFKIGELEAPSITESHNDTTKDLAKFLMPFLEDEIELEHEVVSSQFNSPGSTSLFQSDFNLVLEVSENDFSPEQNFVNVVPSSDQLPHWKSSFYSLMEDSDQNQGAKSIDASHAEQCFSEMLSNTMEMEFKCDEVEQENSPIKFANKHKTRRIISDSEEEEDNDSVFLANEKKLSPIDTASCKLFRKNIEQSTPKCNVSIRKTLDAAPVNRSIASRRSFVSITVEDLEEIEDTMEVDCAQKVEEGQWVEVTGAQNVEEKDLSEEAEECSEESVIPEEEPAGNKLHTKDYEERCLDECESNGFIEESVEEPEDLEESTGEAELQSNEKIEHFTVEDSPKNGLLPSGTPNYETLVMQGKDLMGKGNLTEALNCFLQALDIQTGDAEIQLLTIRLYRKLAQK